MDPRNGQILTAPGASNTQAAIGTPIPGTGNPLNGIKQAGDGIAKTGYTWPNIVVGPRFGVGVRHLGQPEHRAPRRRRNLLRPSGRQHGVLDPGQSADRDLEDLRNGTLQTLERRRRPEPGAGSGAA